MNLKLRTLKAKPCTLLVILLIFLITFYRAVYVNYKETALDTIPKHLHKYLEPKRKYAAHNSTLHLDKLREKIETLNIQREVKNWQKYGPLVSDTTVVVIQVRRDVERLRYLIVSLAQVDAIQTVLLIFSHSFYADNINALIQQIDFCMVLQMFYPNSVQLYPNRFPGPDPGYGSASPGDYDGSYRVERDAVLAELKHHWWWTASVVFDQLVWATIHRDMVIFIDEDSYVLPDFLYMLRICKLSLTYISDASVLSLGRPATTGLDYDKLTVEAWRPPYDKGLAFNRTTWRKISTLSSYYCQYDDSSWNYSLLSLVQQFPGGCAVMVACAAPRVLATGGFPSGRHAYESISSMARSERLFPKKVQAFVLFGLHGRLLETPKPPPNGNGGWSDFRDHLLCFDPLLLTTTVETDFNTTTAESTFTTVLDK